MYIRIFFAVVIFLLAGCNDKYTPKPRGFFRIAFPDKEYQPLNGLYPYRFDIPVYTRIISDKQNPDQPFWINLEVPESRAEVHISYYELTDAEKSSRFFLAELMEETRELAYKHSIKANSIEEPIFINRGDGVFGTVYRIEGNAASPMQFFLTNS